MALEPTSPPQHKISLWSATALSATAMIGSGWLFSAQLCAKMAGNGAFLAWALAALFMLLVGLCLSEVVSIYPVRGATTRSSALSHNAIFGMPFAFANWFGILAAVATEAEATTEYLSSCLKQEHLMNAQGLSFHGQLFATLILLFYLLVNFYGVQLLAKINNLITVFKIATPLFVIVALLIAHFDKSNFSLPGTSHFSLSAALATVIDAGLIYSYNGFQLAVAFASEVEHPRRNVPLSILLSIGIMMFLYMAIELVFMGAVPHSMIASGGWASLNFHSPLLNLAMLLGMNFLVVLLMADSVISPSGTGYAYLGGCSRMFHAMATAGQMPHWLAGKIHPFYHFSRRSLITNWILVAILLWSAHGWASLVIIVTGYHLIGYMAAPVSMGALKPERRLFGAIVFTLIGYVMTRMPHQGLAEVTLSMLLMMFFYGVVELIHGKLLPELLLMTFPFLFYLGGLYFSQNIWWVIALSCAFYGVITDARFVAFCQRKRDPQESALES